MVTFTDAIRKGLSGTPRLLMQVELKPLQGDRFQATGFPDIGPATYTRPDGTEMLLVESSQSMANRLEEVCWDFATNDLAPPLRGMPYLKVDLGNEKSTNSILEAHRLNSPYILEGNDQSFMETLKQELNVANEAPVDIRLLASIIFKYDPNSVIHGIFLAKEKLAGGRFRLKRCLSSFIEAEDVGIVESGGVKIDIVDPSGDTAKGFGNVPFHRLEFVARKIMAYFNLDVSLLFSYGLDEAAEAFLLVLSLWKIRKFLEVGTRLRTACDLAPQGEIQVISPGGFKVPAIDEIEKALPKLIEECGKKGLFAEPPVTRVKYVKNKKEVKNNEQKGNAGEA